MSLEKEPWAAEMREFLKGANLRLRGLKSSGTKLTYEEISDLKKDYTAILTRVYAFHGVEAIPNLISKVTGPPIKTKKDKKQKVGKNLLDRLNRYQVEVLAFLCGGVPFSNNAAEQVIRVAKVKQKISGCFRSSGGAVIFYQLRSVILLEPESLGLNIA